MSCWELNLKCQYKFPGQYDRNKVLCAYESQGNPHSEKFENRPGIELAIHSMLLLNICSFIASALYGP